MLNVLVDFITLFIQNNNMVSILICNRRFTFDIWHCRFVKRLYLIWGRTYGLLLLACSSLCDTYQDILGGSCTHISLMPQLKFICQLYFYFVVYFAVTSLFCNPLPPLFNLDAGDIKGVFHSSCRLFLGMSWFVDPCGF